jgi:hypothetical protein
MGEGSFSEFNPIEMVRTVGEKAALRPFNTEDPKDIQKLRDIDHWSETLKWVYDPGAPLYEAKGLRNWVKDFFQNRRYKTLFAISSSDESIPAFEKGEAQGWIRMDAAASVNTRLKNALGISLANLPNPIEVTYVKHPEAPKGLMASGLRQACWQVSRMDGSITDDQAIPHRIIFAFVKPENLDSITVLDHSGFVKKASGVYWHLNDPLSNPHDKYDCFVLDWAKLQNITQAKALNELINLEVLQPELNAVEN